MTPNLRAHLTRLIQTRPRRFAAATLALLIAAGVSVAVRAALQSASPAAPQLASILPQGALLTIDSKDFAGLLKRWSDSPEKSAWLKSDSYSAFSRSRLFGRLGDAQKEFERSAGLPPDASFLNEVAGRESVFAWYDIGKLEFLYITRMPSDATEKTRLVQMRGKFSRRQIGSQTFYVRTLPDLNGPGQDQPGPDQPDQSHGGEPRTVAFATSGDLLLLATREDLMACALTLLSSSGTSAATDTAAVHPLLAEQWFIDARAAAAKEPGDLRMTLNLEKIVSSPYFRSYWVQGNITDMKQYRSAVADIYTDAGTFREERVLLPKSAQADTATASDLAALTSLVPDHAGVYRAQAAPSVEAAVASLNEKLIQRGVGTFSDTRIAPDADVSVQTAGSASDLETRIDSAPLAQPAKGAELDSLKQTLAAANLDAMMTVSRTGQAADGIWVPFQSAVVLSSAQPWNPGALQSALQQATGSRLTTSSLGLAWKPVKFKNDSYFELSETRPLEMAVRGRLCILTDDAGLMQEMLARASNSQPERKKGKKAAANTNADASQAQATMIAGFNLAQERSPFARWTALVDRTNGTSAAPSGQDSSGASGSQPSFFSQTMRGLGDTFAALESERFIERRDGPLIRQTVAYTWQH